MKTKLRATEQIHEQIGIIIHTKHLYIHWGVRHYFRFFNFLLHKEQNKCTPTTGFTLLLRMEANSRSKYN